MSASAAVAAVAVLTGLVVTGQAQVRTDLLGRAYTAPVLGPLVPLVVPYVVLACVYCFVTLWRARGLAPTTHRALVAGFAVYGLSALNDLLQVAGLIQSVRVFDFAFVAVAVGLSYTLARRYNQLNARLQHEVAARTAQLTALLGAARSVVTGLDLASTLERITAEAGRIAATPHVKILLLDPETALLRPVGSSGAPMAGVLAVPLGGRYSGIVAATGRPLFIADTQSDPQNPLIERDREYGIRTYLGLPIRAGETVLGVLTFNTEQPRAWPDEELAYLASFADQAAIALANARLYEAESAARREAQAALAQVKQLQGLLPICAWCKRVRNDRNYWEQIEGYISERTEATFSHGICPECREKFRASRS